MFRAYTPIFRSNGCYSFFTYAEYGVFGIVVQHAISTHTPQDRHLTTPRTPYAVYVKKLSIAPEDGRESPKHVELKVRKKYSMALIW